MAKIKIKNSVTPGSVPSGLSFGEMAVNIADKTIFIGNAVEGVVTLYDQNGLVTSVNGATGAITNVAKTDTAQTFTATQQFAAGISAAGATFATAIRVEGFVDVGLGGGGNSTNLMVGYLSLDANTSGLNNTAVGYNTLGLNQDGTSNLAIGSNSLASNVSGSSNTAVGSSALQYSTSNNNTAVGSGSLESLGFFGLGVGSENVAVGYQAAKSDISSNPIWGITGGIIIGYDARPNANNGINEIVIGYNGRGNGSNTTTIGNTSTTKSFIHGQANFSSGISASNGITFNSEVLIAGAKLGVNRTASPSYSTEVNSTSGACLRLIYNDTSNTSPTNYVDFNVSTTGDLTINPSGGDIILGDETLSRVELLDYFERGVTGTINAKTSTLTLDLSTSQVFSVALVQNITTITISNVPDNGNSNAVGFTLIFIADGTARTVTWPASVKWPSATAPTLTSTNAKADIFSFVSTDSGSNWYGFIGGQNF